MYRNFPLKNAPFLFGSAKVTAGGISTKSILFFCKINRQNQIVPFLELMPFFKSGRQR